MEYQIFLAGVGGQGILSVTDILCNAAVNMGFKVHGSETHGMSQRGGSVFSNVRFGDIHHGDIFSPLITERDSDVLLGFEPTEALRHAQYVKPNGLFLVNIHPIPSPSFTLTKSSYPEIEHIISALQTYSPNVVSFDATKLASDLGMSIVQNIVMLGALSAVYEIPLSVDSLKVALKKQFKAKHFNLNLKAFEVGRQAYENNNS